MTNDDAWNHRAISDSWRKSSGLPALRVLSMVHVELVASCLAAIHLAIAWLGEGAGTLDSCDNRILCTFQTHIKVD